VKRTKVASKTSRYEVGYCKPPAQHRFVKGRSGNPKGGSGKRRNDAHEERIKSLIIDEAYREVALREGDNVIKLPVIQAVIRQLAMAAAKGQPRSQRMLADLVRWVKGDRRELNLEFLKTMIEYKQYWDQELERRERLGLAGPEPLPHPDDILIDFGTGEVTFKGHRTREQKAAQEEMIALKEGLEADAKILEELVQKLPNNRRLAKALGENRKYLCAVAEFEQAPSRRPRRTG
jgi:hypothetical protein